MPDNRVRSLVHLLWTKESFRRRLLTGFAAGCHEW
jgi:hypothetical protein